MTLWIKKKHVTGCHHRSGSNRLHISYCFLKITSYMISMALTPFQIQRLLGLSPCLQPHLVL